MMVCINMWVLTILVIQAKTKGELLAILFDYCQWRY